MKRLALTLALLVGFSAACGAKERSPERAAGELAPFDSVGPSNSGGTVAPAGSPGSTPAAPGAAPSGTPESPADLPLGNMDPPSTEPASSSESSTVASSPLPRSTPEAEGVDSAGLLALVNALDTQITEVHSMMLVRHGKVVAEGWWAPYTAADIHVMYSVSKSFNGTAVGLAIEAGLLGLDDTLLSHFPDLAPANPSPNMANMKVRNLLSMATGHTTDTVDTLRARADGQWTRAFLETDVPNPPGTNFLYNSGAAYVLGSLVQHVTGMTVQEYLQPRLFEPLGIQNPLWGKSPEGVNLGDGGLAIRTEDLAKFGQLYLQGGLWNGEQLIPADWVSEATSSQISTGNQDGNWNWGYGFQFWRNAGVGFRADGSLGQFSFVLPEYDAVLAITSGTQDTDGVMNVVWQNLLPALQDAALPENAAAQSNLTSKLASLALDVPTGTFSSPRSTDVTGRRYTVAQNPQDIRAVALDFSTDLPTLTFEDADGPHAISVGLGNWVRGRTGFKKRINELFDTPDQGISATGAWANADTFVARLCFNETPYTMITSLRFQGEQVFVDNSYSVRWGDLNEAQIVGTR